MIRDPLGPIEPNRQRDVVYPVSQLVARCVGDYWHAHGIGMTAHDIKEVGIRRVLGRGWRHRTAEWIADAITEGLIEPYATDGVTRYKPTPTTE